MRKAAFAGLFYPREKERLLSLMSDCFHSSFGPGSLPSKNSLLLPSIKAIIVPHAGYVYSGMAAAWAYKELAESEFPDLFILIGPNHHSNISSICSDDYSTPLGTVTVDKSFAESLSSKGSIKINNKVHEQEHSLEVQIPFLQFIFKNKMDDLRILPLLVSHDVNIDVLAKDIKKTISESGKKITFIISSDFTHQGINYGYVPFSKNIKQNLQELDMKSINYIKKGDVDGFKNHISETESTVCGYFPIILLLKTITFKHTELKKYYTSADIAGDYNNSVSYASIIFR